MFRIGDYVRAKPGHLIFLDETITYQVEDVLNNGSLLKLHGVTGLLVPSHFTLTTGKHDVRDFTGSHKLIGLEEPILGYNESVDRTKELTYEEIVGITNDLEVVSWDFPVFPMPEPRGKCECGSDAINAGTHSTWCAAYQE